jgi:hypothetical protein
MAEFAHCFRRLSIGQHLSRLLEIILNAWLNAYVHQDGALRVFFCRSMWSYIYAFIIIRADDSFITLTR